MTIDFDTLEDEAVTIRYRDSMEQKRMTVDEVIREVEESLNFLRLWMRH